ncbi:MAG TPA: dipeptide epimerase [Chloroflexi bacterium]|nr:dipeptide epimerase [Chloroflexota bacterium]
MRLTVEPITLHLKTPFRIAHGTSTARYNVLVHLGDGVGEAALAPQYGYTQADVAAYVEGLDLDALGGDDPLALEESLDRLPAGPPPARAAVDVALHDLWGRRLGHPLYRLWGLSPARCPLSSLTLSIAADEQDMRRQVREARGFPILKLKLGSGDVALDEALVRAARQETDVRLCVDANSAWSVDEAAGVIPRLAAYDLLFIEQPIAAAEVQDWHALRRRLPSDMPPLVADESVHQAADITALVGAVDGVNIKLAKAGGLGEARCMITLARALGMRVMLGCMVESSVGITAAVHLAPLADWADLDGNLSILADPYDGARMTQGRLDFPDGPGLGVTRRSEREQDGNETGK